MERYKSLEVYIAGKMVGTLATHQRSLIAFEYADSWRDAGYAISPFSLPLQKKVYIPKADPFDGLYGVFADSLPDGWGRLLVDRTTSPSQSVRPSSSPACARNSN